MRVVQWDPDHLSRHFAPAGHEHGTSRRRHQGAAPEIEAQMPASLQLGVRSDRSVSIRDSVEDVKFTLLLTVFLVVMVIFLFLRNLSAPSFPRSRCRSRSSARSR